VVIAGHERGCHGRPGERLTQSKRSPRCESRWTAAPSTGTGPRSSAATSRPLSSRSRARPPTRWPPARSAAQLPQVIEQAIEASAGIDKAGERFASRTDFLFLDHVINHAFALEGALKPKEISP
jgi:hypothetical protein